MTGFDQPPPGGVLPAAGGFGAAPVLPAGLPGSEALSMGAMMPGMGLPTAPLGFSNGFSGTAPPMIGTQSLGLGEPACLRTPRPVLCPDLRSPTLITLVALTTD